MYAHLYKRKMFCKVRSYWPRYKRSCEKRVSCPPGKQEGQVLVVALQRPWELVPGLYLCGAGVAPSSPGSITPSSLLRTKFCVFRSTSCSKCQEIKEQLCSPWIFWKWKKRCNVKRILMLFLLDDSANIVSERDSLMQALLCACNPC